MGQLILFIGFVAFTYFVGRIIETKHYKSIRERERMFLELSVTTTKHLPDEEMTVQQSSLVSGSVVVSLDYFKRILAGLRNIFGGEVSAYETLIDRARREAILRMKESAIGYDAVLNLRLQTSCIGQSANKRGSIGSIEVLAYGTAIRINK